MLFHLNFSSKSPFVPELKVPVFAFQIEPTFCSRLKEIALAEENYILENYKSIPRDDMETEEGYKWITNRAYEYSLFDFIDKYPELDILKQQIKHSYTQYVEALNLPVEQLYIHCWVNIVRLHSRTITIHNHAHEMRLGDQECAYISGNLCVQTENTNTYFQSPILDKRNISVKNNNTEVVMFPSYIDHWADDNKSFEPRITIAFDLITKDLYDKNLMFNRDIFSPL